MPKVLQLLSPKSCSQALDKMTVVVNNSCCCCYYYCYYYYYLVVIVIPILIIILLLLLFEFLVNKEGVSFRQYQKIYVRRLWGFFFSLIFSLQKSYSKTP